MSQNFLQAGDTISVQVAADVTKIYAGTPVVISGGYIRPAGAQSGIDGIATATCAGTADPGNYISNICTYRTGGVFAFKPASGTTLAVGDTAYIAVVDNTTASPVSYEQVGARTTIHNTATASTGDVALGIVVALGAGWGQANAPTGYGQVQIGTRISMQLANK